MNNNKSERDDAKPSTASGSVPAGQEKSLPNLAASGDAPEWLESGSDSKRWGTIFSNETRDRGGASTSASAADLEPELAVTAEDVALEEPSLASVRISDETADAAELEAVAEEARRVAEEAEKVSRLAGGPPPVKAPVKAPAGTQGKKSPNNNPDAKTPPNDDVDKVNEGSTPSEGADTSDETRDSGAATDLEPKLAVTAEDVALEEPSLASVRISDETADAAELEAVAEEARRVAEEAEKASRLAGGPPPVKAPVKAPAGTQGKRSPNNNPDTKTPPNDDLDKVNEGSTPSEGADTPEETMNPQQSPPRSKPAAHLGAGGSASGWTPSSGSSDQDPPKKPRTRGSHSAPVKTKHLPLILVGLAVLAALALIIFIVVSLFRGGAGGSSSGKAEGVIAQEVSPLDLQEGQCLQSFEDINSEVTVVTCDTPHNAQLVSTFTYPDDTQYPGRESLQAKATETCKGATLNADAIRKFDELRQTQASPGEKTWSNGDRRVDCYVFTDKEDALVESLLTS